LALGSVFSLLIGLSGWPLDSWFFSLCADRSQFAALKNHFIGDEQLSDIDCGQPLPMAVNFKLTLW